MKTFLLINLWPKTPVCFYYTYILFISFVYNLAKKTQHSIVYNSNVLLRNSLHYSLDFIPLPPRAFLASLTTSSAEPQHSVTPDPPCP